MLCIETDRILHGLIPNELMNIGAYGSTPIRLRPAYIGDIFLPFVFNDIKVTHNYYGVTPETLQENLNNLKEKLNNTDTQYNINYIYTNYVHEDTAVFDEMFKDNLTELKNGIQELYNKCMQQAIERDSYSSENNIVIRFSESLKSIFIITNIQDYIQYSEEFLTIGLLPILFPEIEEKFNKEEMDLCRQLVKRSQIKRINNSEVANLFKIMVATSKYQASLKDIKFKTIINNYIANKLNNIQNEIDNIRTYGERLLRDYSNYCAQYDKLNVELTRVRNNEEDYKSNISTALNQDYIVNFDISYDNLDIIFKTTLDFYEVDEAELVIKNIQNDIIKQLFTDVFLTQKYKLNVLSRFRFKDTNDSLDIRSIDYDLSSQYDGLYNPHLQYYNCLGDFKPALVKSQKQGDLVMFNSIVYTSTRSLNFRDAAVLNRFISNLSDAVVCENYLTKVKCLIDSDGNTHSIKELYMDNDTPIELELRDGDDL